MSKYIYFTPEEKARAQNTDLVSLLRAQGERPVRSGREFRTPNDPSITVRGNKWFDHSKREGGYAVSFVQRYYRLPYQEAVLLLLGRKNGKSYEQAKPAKEAPKPFALPEPYGTMRRMYAYLMRQRHIDREVISYFVHEKLLYEDKHHNCVFVGLDGSGEAKHAHIRSTNSEGRVFRMNIESSASEHCFHKDGTDKSLYVFEAPSISCPTSPSTHTAGRSTATSPAAGHPSSRCWNGCGRIQSWTRCTSASTTMTRAMTPATA